MWARAILAALAPGGGGGGAGGGRAARRSAFGGEEGLFFLEEGGSFLAVGPDINEVLALLGGGFVGNFGHGLRFLLLQGLETGGLRGAGGEGAVGGVGLARGIGREGG